MLGGVPGVGSCGFTKIRSPLASWEVDLEAAGGDDGKRDAGEVEEDEQ